MKSFSHFLLSIFEFLPMASFKALPFAIAIVVFIILLFRSPKPPFGVTSGTYQVVRRLWWMAIAFAGTSLLFFVYILLQPQRGKDIRWLSSVAWFDAPRMAEMNHLEGPVVSSVNPVIDAYNGVSGGVNFLGDQINDLENFRRAYSHTFALSLPLLVYVLVAAALIFLLSKVVSSLRDKALKESVEQSAEYRLKNENLRRKVDEMSCVLREIVVQLDQRNLIELNATYVASQDELFVHSDGSDTDSHTMRSQGLLNRVLRSEM